MRDNTSSSLAALRAELLAVTKTCEVARCSTDGCPLCKLASLPLAKRRAWLAALNPAELQYLASYHRVCVRLKSPDDSVITSLSAFAS